MEWVMKILMGGWLPEGKRTQWLAFGAAVGAVIMAVLQWGTGEMSFTNLMTFVSDKWPIFLATYFMYFQAEKVDAVKEVVAKAINGKK